MVRYFYLKAALHIQHSVHAGALTRAETLAINYFIDLFYVQYSLDRRESLNRDKTQVTDFYVVKPVG